MCARAFELGLLVGERGGFAVRGIVGSVGGGLVEATFDLVETRLDPQGKPAERIGYFLALHDFDDDGPIAGGNILLGVLTLGIGTVVGAAVDSANGAVHKYDSAVELTLVKKP